MQTLGLLDQETAGHGEPSTGAATDLGTGTVCVQWVWGDDFLHPPDIPAVLNGDQSSSNGGGSSSFGVDKKTERTDGQEEVGLYPARTAFILLASAPLSSSEEGQEKSPVGDGGGGDDGQGSLPSVNFVRMLASEADQLRRRASQLKVSR